MTDKIADGLRLENVALKSEVQELGRINNTLGSLVDAAQQSTNLTSFNPIIANNVYAPLTINHLMLTYLYKTHGVIQTGIDTPVLDALRGGLELESKTNELDGDDLIELADWLEENVMEQLMESLFWKRLYGGAGLVINTDQRPDQPLDLRKLRRLEFYAANRWELISQHRKSEFFMFYGQKMHASRVLTMIGKPAPWQIRWQLQGWGMSECERIVAPLNSFLQTDNVIYELLREAKLDVYMLDGLASQLLSSTGTQKTRERIQLMNTLKNFNNAVVMDVKDKFEQKQITFTGLAEVMEKNMMKMAAAWRIPCNKLWGIGAQGFSSGEDDIENYNSLVESEERSSKARRVIKTLLTLGCIHLWGVPHDVSFTFKALRGMSSKEEEEVKTSKQARYQSDYDRGLLTSEEYGQICQKEKLIPIQTAASQGLLDEHPTLPGQEGEDGGNEKKGGGKDE